MRKLLLTLLMFNMIQLSSCASLQLEDLTSPQEKFYRLGTTDTPEVKVDFEVHPIIQPVVQKEVTVQDSQNLIIHQDNFLLIVYSYSFSVNCIFKMP